MSIDELKAHNVVSADGSELGEADWPMAGNTGIVGHFCRRGFDVV